MKKCTGCHLNDPSITEINKYTNTPRPACTTTCRQSDALYVPTMTKKFKNEGAQLSISTFALKQLIKHHYFSNNNLPHLTQHTTYPESIRQAFDSQINIISPFTLINKYVISHEHKVRLTTIAHNFANRHRFVFYTDGSVKRTDNSTDGAIA